MAENVISGDTFIKDGNTNTERVTINNDKSIDGIAGSILTVKKDAEADSSDVAVFIDVSKVNTEDKDLSQVFALVARTVNNAAFNGKGLVGANLVGRNTSSGNFEYIKGSFSEADKSGDGDLDFLIGVDAKASIGDGSGSVIGIARGISSDTEIDADGVTINNAQGIHPSIQMTNGTIGQVDCLYLDLDYDNTGSLVVTGDIAYIRAGNDSLPTPTGNTYFIKSDVTHPSELAGSIKSTKFLVDGVGDKIEFNNQGNVGDKTSLYFKNTNADDWRVGSEVFNSGLGNDTKFTISRGIFNVLTISDNISFNYPAELNRTASQIELGNNKSLLNKEWVEDSVGVTTGFYEEGTFTPTLTDNGGGASYSATVDFAKYVRNGNSVSFQIKLLSISTTGTPTGNLRVNGLPFNAINLSYLDVESSGGNISYSSIKGQTGGDTSYINIRYKNTGDTGFSNVYSSVTFTSGSIIISGTYLTDAY